MLIRRAAIVLFVVALGLLYAGCGSDDPTGQKGKAVKICLNQAEKITDDAARKTAVESCRAAESGDQSKARKAAEEQCLQATKQIPDEKARKQAEANCRAVRQNK